MECRTYSKFNKTDQGIKTDSWMTVISPVGLSPYFWDDWAEEKLPGWEMIGWGDDYDGEHRRLGYPDGIGPE